MPNAEEYYGDVGFNKKQAIQLVFDKTTSVSVPAVEGQVRWNPTTHSQENYNGIEWVSVPGGANILPTDYRFVSHTYTTTDSKHFTDINAAITSLGSGGGVVEVYSGIYNNNMTIPYNVTLNCSAGVLFTGHIEMVENSKILGYANFEQSDGGYVIALGGCVLEGINIQKVFVSGRNVSIQCYELGQLIASANETGYGITVHTHRLGTVITTAVPIGSLSSYQLMPNSDANGYCCCTWTHESPVCNYSKKCLMTADPTVTKIPNDGSVVGTLTIYANERTSEGYTFAGFGELIINCLNVVPLTNYNTRHYVANPFSKFIHRNCDEDNICSRASYNVSNQAVLILDNITSRTTGNYIVNLLTADSKASSRGSRLISNSYAFNAITAGTYIAIMNNAYSYFPISANCSLAVNSGNVNCGTYNWI